MQDRWKQGANFGWNRSKICSIQYPSTNAWDPPPRFSDLPTALVCSTCRSKAQVMSLIWASFSFLPLSALLAQWTGNKVIIHEQFSFSSIFAPCFSFMAKIQEPTLPVKMFGMGQKVSSHLPRSLLTNKLWRVLMGIKQLKKKKKSKWPLCF